MNKILKAILSGKSKKEVLNMMSEKDLVTLTEVAKSVGLNRQQRRKLMRQK